MEAVEVTMRTMHDTLERKLERDDLDGNLLSTGQGLRAEAATSGTWADAEMNDREHQELYSKINECVAKVQECVSLISTSGIQQ